MVFIFGSHSLPELVLGLISVGAQFQQAKTSLEVPGNLGKGWGLKILYCPTRVVVCGCALLGVGCLAISAFCRSFVLWSAG